MPGTTRDSIDTGLTYEGTTITLIDTAGIRRRGSVEPGIEKYSVLRSMQAIDRADVALLLIDAVDGVTAQDAHVAGYVIEKMKSVVVVVNKWDAIEKDEHTMNDVHRDRCAMSSSSSATSRCSSSVRSPNNVCIGFCPPCSKWPTPVATA